MVFLHDLGLFPFSGIISCILATGLSQKKDLNRYILNIYRKPVEHLPAYPHFFKPQGVWYFFSACVLHSFHRVYYDNEMILYNKKSSRVIR